MGRLFLSIFVGVALFLAVAYAFDLFGVADPGTPSVPSATTDPERNPDTTAGASVDLGGPLYNPAPVVPLPSFTRSLVVDPVVLTGHLGVMDKIDVSSPLPGKLLFIGEEVPEGAAQVAGCACFAAPPYESTTIPRVIVELKDESTRIVKRDADITVLYRRLYENEVVKQGAMVAKMDPTKILGDLAVKMGKVKAAAADSRAAEYAHQEAHVRWERAKKLREERVISEEDYGAALLTKIKFQEEAVSKKQGLYLTATELELSEILLKQHEIRNEMPVRLSRVKQLFRGRGEAIKEQEPIMQLYSSDRLIAEALLETQFRDRVKEGMRVTIEPIEEQAPLRTLRANFGEVTAVAFTKDEDFPHFLSASSEGDLYGIVCLWDLYAKRPLRQMLHPSPVKALAATPPGSKYNLAVTGCQDGSIRLWDLTKPDALPRVIKKAHSQAISVLAFSPDGEFFASGSEDASINLYRTSDEQLVYPLDFEHGAGDPHRGSITALAFTPQGLLISAARDQTVRFWQLKTKGASLYGRPIAGRMGNVNQLGVSPDGRWMLFDRGKDLQVLSASDGTRYSTLPNPGGYVFETLALFSPDSALILTGRAGDSRLQLWRPPDEKQRGFEFRQFVPRESTTVTCAAFSALAAKGGQHALAISGTKDGYVYLWTLPSTKQLDAHAIRDVPIRLVSQSLDASSRQLRIGIEIPNAMTAENPEGRLNAGRPVTIVIE